MVDASRVKAAFAGTATSVVWLALALAGPLNAAGQANPPADSSLVARVVALEAALQQQLAINSGLVQRVAALEHKLGPLERTDGVGVGTEWILTGVNLHVRNGLGATGGIPNSPTIDFGPVVSNGLGNLVVGYNESSSGVDRTGSHNVVLGVRNSYSSVAGIVGGQDNLIAGPASVVLTGKSSDASGRFSVVVSGQDNEALGDRSLIASGAFNKADSNGAIFAGTANTTFGPTTCASENPPLLTCAGSGIVLGGSFNKAGGGTVISGIENLVVFGGTIVGGISNTLLPIPFNTQFNGTLGVVVGGEGNTIDGGRTPVLLGGNVITTSTDYAVVP